MTKERWLAAIKKRKYVLHDCSACGFPCAFYYREDQLGCDNGCWCTNMRGGWKSVTDESMDFYFNPDNGHLKDIKQFCEDVEQGVVRMRTPEEIVKAIKANTSILGFYADTLLPYLEFATAKEFLKEGAQESGWAQRPLTREHVIVEMRDYADFGWGKIEDHRGISANRTVGRMEAWLWVLGDDETLVEIKAAGYAQYGAPKLALVCNKYGLKIPRSNRIDNMIEGRSCQDRCMEGCGQ